MQVCIYPIRQIEIGKVFAGESFIKSADDRATQCSRILFLNGEGQGMYSVIEKKRPNDFMLFRHLGEIDNDKEQPPYKQSSTESYILTESDGKTHLKVELLVEEEYEDYFFKQFPVALKKIKMLAE